MSISLSSGAASAAAPTNPAPNVPPKTVSSAAPAPAAAVPLNSPRRVTCLLRPCWRKRSIVWVMMILPSLNWRPNGDDLRVYGQRAGLALRPEQRADGVEYVLRLGHRLEALRHRVGVR